MTDNTTSHKSSDYDHEIVSTIPYYDSFHGETINLVKSIFQHKKKWLDTGCGTGELIKKALAEFPDFEFYLADPSEDMLQLCKKKIGKRPVQILGKYDTANLCPGFKVDIVTAIQSHHYLNPAQREAATQKCYDLLNDDGVYITFENIKPESSFGIENSLKRWGNYQLIKGRNIRDIADHKERFNTKYFPITIFQHLELLKRTGFRYVELFWMSHMQAGFYGIK